MITNIIGLGGAGANIVEFLHSKNKLASYVNISTPVRNYDEDHISFFSFPHPFDFENEVRKSINRKKMVQMLSKKLDLSKETIVIAGLGGYTGTNMVKELVDSSKDSNLFTYWLVLPFFMETEKRKIADLLISQIQHKAKIITIDLERYKSTYEDLNIKDFFTAVNNEIYSSIFRLN